LESNAPVTVEAENGQRLEGLTHAWLTTTVLSGYEGESYLHALPDIDVLIPTEAITDSPTAVYPIHFSTPGDYRVWSRAYADNADADAVNVGLKHHPPEFALWLSIHSVVHSYRAHQLQVQWRRKLDEEAILSLFKQAVQKQQVKISLHAAEEALAEEITRTEIETVLLTAQIVGNYPDWWLGPSCLIYGRTETGRDLHLVASCLQLPVTIITVYEPRPPKWLTPTQRGGDR
jgi:hypothetical protein